jgi:RNA polymerase subunit RPABC4/transcription elongation factor Spt4
MVPEDGRDAAPGERVRFCLRCGAVVEFALSRCPACGQAEPAATAGPRAACEGCGAARPAELRICPACGREAPGDWPPVPRGAGYAVPQAGASLAWLVLLAWLAPAVAALGLALALR